MDLTAFRNRVYGYIASFRLDIIDEAAFTTGLDELTDELESIAHDAVKAERRGIDLDDAARDFDRFPALARLHALVESVITMSLSPSLLHLVKLAAAAPPPRDHVLAMLARMVESASRDPDRELGALCRVLLFEVLRLEPLLALRLFPAQTFGKGMKVQDADAIALRTLEVWLTLAPALPKGDDVNVVRLMSEEVEMGLRHHIEVLRDILALVDQDAHDAFVRRAALEAILSHAEASDALLIRNAMPDVFEVQHLTIDMLKARHPLLLADKKNSALRKQLERLRRRTADEEPTKALRRSGIALLDIIAEMRNVELPTFEPWR